MLIIRKISLGLAVALVAAILAGPASAMPADFHGHAGRATTRSSADARPIPTPPTWPLHPQPIRPPTATTASNAASDSTGFDWESAGIGAAAMLGALAVAYTGVAGMRRRHGARLDSLTSH